MRAILTYHSLDESASPISIPAARFRSHLLWLREEAVPVVDLETLMALPSDADAVTITFDDGFRNFATEALPVASDLGIPLTLFVVTGHVGGDNGWGGCPVGEIPSLPLLDWEEVGGLPDRGVTLGSHTCFHRWLPDCSLDELTDELAGSAEELERRVGLRPAAVAYPYGGVSPRVAEAAGQVYRFGCSTAHRVLGEPINPLALPRVDMWYFRDPGPMPSWGSRVWRWRVGTRHRLRQVRAAVQGRGRP